MLHLKEKPTDAVASSLVFWNFIKDLYSGRKKIPTLHKLFVYTRQHPSVKDLRILKESSLKTISQFIRFHRLLIFHTYMSVLLGFPGGRHFPKNEVQEYSAPNFTSSTDDLIFCIPKDNNPPISYIGRDSHVDKNHHLYIRHLHSRVIVTHRHLRWNGQSNSS